MKRRLDVAVWLVAAPLMGLAVWHAERVHDVPEMVQVEQPRFIQADGGFNNETAWQESNRVLQEKCRDIVIQAAWGRKGITPKILHTAYQQCLLTVEAFI